MPNGLMEKFYWNELEAQDCANLAAPEKYQALVSWSEKARGHNPNAFDALTEWILDEDQWRSNKLAENERILMQGVLARFIEQNARIRALLKELEPSGAVNSAAFEAIDRFDDELAGRTQADWLKEAVAKVFADFSVMKERDIRTLIAGSKTGASGTDHAEIFGYINRLKDCDAGVQWALFMPGVVAKQQQGFKVVSFEYKEMPAMRFIGFEGEEYADRDKRMKKMEGIRSLSEGMPGLDFDVLLMHHYGLCVDVGAWHGVWGRFMKADTLAPEGFISFDFLPHCDQNPGPPYLPKFAYATFSGDRDAMHKREGYDSDAMYDVTRNIILGQGKCIPYPDKYWTAEVFASGCDSDSTAYMFSVAL